MCAKPAMMDGKSIVPFLMEEAASDTGVATAKLLQATRSHLDSLLAEGGIKGYKAAWREEVFIEYYYCEHNDKCVEHCHTPLFKYPHADEDCGDLANSGLCWSPICDQNCYRTEDTSNNYIAIRRPAGTSGGNILYAEFQTGDLAAAGIEFDEVDFVEFYDLATDPWQMNNTQAALSAEYRKELSARVHKWYSCAGDACP